MLAIAAFCAALVALDASAGAQPLALDDALRLAQERSRRLAAHGAAIAASREMAVAAGERPDPTVTAGVNNLPIHGADAFSLTRDFMTMRSIAAMQELTRADKLRARAARFEREAEVGAADQALALADLRRDAALAWLDGHYLERMQELLRRQRAEAALQVDASDASYRGGKASQAELFATRSALAQIDDRIGQTALQLATARARLARWIGADAARPFGGAPDIAADVTEAGAVEQIEHHPQIALLAAQEALARADAEVARSNRRSDWSIELMFSQRGPAYSNMVSVNVSTPLRIDRKNRQDRELAAKLASAEQMRARREDSTLEHGAQVRAWIAQWRGNRERLAHHDAALIPLAGERTQAALAAYRGGSAALSAVLEARRAEIDARIDRLRLEMETAALWAQLHYLAAPRDGER